MVGHKLVSSALNENVQKGHAASKKAQGAMRDDDMSKRKLFSAARLSEQKGRLVADLVRGKSVEPILRLQTF